MLPAIELLSQEISLSLVLATGQDSAQQIELRKLNLSAELSAAFKEIAIEAIKKLHALEQVQFNPEVQAAERSCLVLNLQEEQGIKTLINQMMQLSNIAPYEADEPKFIKRLNFYALVIQAGDKKILLCREFKASKVLSFGKGLTAMFAKSTGAFQMLEDSLFRFDDMIDCVYYEHNMFISNPAGFMRIFNYYQHIAQKAHQALASIAEQIPIANFADFQEVCLSDRRMQQKLASIVNQDYFKALDFGRVTQVIDRHQLEVPVIEEAGEPKLQFSADLKHRWTILKLLDDDYLESPLTEHSYEANSKVRIARRKKD